MPRRRMTLKQHLFRLLGVVSPSGSYPLPPRWAMSRKGRDTWYPGPVVAIGDRSVAAGGDTGFVRTGCACGQVCICGPAGAGPLTDFRHDPPRHVCAPTCQPADGGPATCFTARPYGQQKGAQGC